MPICHVGPPYRTPGAPKGTCFSDQQFQLSALKFNSIRPLAKLTNHAKGILGQWQHEGVPN